MDTILVNGNVLTIDGRQPRASAVSVLNGKILSVGDNATIRAEAGPGTRVIDLAGRTMLPGLNDNHCHPMGYGFMLGWVDASPMTVQTLGELQDSFRRAASNAAPGTWIRGRGYDDTRLDIVRHPTRYELDKVTGDHPAILTRTCGHMSVVNSKALELASITRDTPNPVGGEIDRDADGEPTGLLKERAQELVRRLFPPTTAEDIKQALRAAGDKLLAMGITSVADAGIRNAEEMQAYQELRRSGELRLRTYLMMIIDNTLDSLANLGIRTGMGDEWLRIGPAKMLQDGSGGGRTAAMYSPYPNEPDNYGITVYSQEELDEGFAKAAAAGFQGAAHAIGNKAIDMIITAFERALAKHPQQDHRWRIEHAGMMTPRLLARMRELNLVAVPQPSFVYFLGDSYLRNFNDDTIALAYPCRTFIDMGIPTIGSSDAPVTPAEPWFNIRAACTRLTQDGQMMGDGQQVSIDEALDMFTMKGAFGSFEEHIKGSITPGKLADLIVIDRDPYAIPAEELHTIQNELTMVDGKVVYEH